MFAWSKLVHERGGLFRFILSLKRLLSISKKHLHLPFVIYFRIKRPNILKHTLIVTLKVTLTLLIIGFKKKKLCKAIFKVNKIAK